MGVLALGVALCFAVVLDGGHDGVADATAGNAVKAQASPSTALLSLEQTRTRVDELQVEVQVAVLQKQVDDQNLDRARDGVEELRQEARDIAESTVEGAINAYQNTDRTVGLLELDDLNETMRAGTLGDAALVADTETFDRFYDKQRDLELAQYELVVRSEQNEELGLEVAELQRELDRNLAWLARLEENQLHQTARQESARASAWAQSRGRKQGAFLLVCPVDGPHSFIDSWGFARSGGRRHKGVDILAKPGVPVVAPVSGRVEHRSNRVGGRSFHLYDEHGNYFYGTHMSGYGKSGQVRAGEVIGYVGDDGNAAGIPHLHFEIHAGGRGNQINPFVDTAAVCSGARY